MVVLNRYLFLLFSLAFLSFSGDIYAQEFGQDLYCTVRNIMRGSIGTLIGLSIAFVGFVLFIIKDDKSYLKWLLVGMAVTAYPGLFESTIDSMGKASSAVQDNKPVAATRAAMYGSCDGRSIAASGDKKANVLVQKDGVTVNANDGATNPPSP